MKVYKTECFRGRTPTEGKEITFLFDREDHMSYLCITWRHEFDDRGPLYAGYTDRCYGDDLIAQGYEPSSWLELLVLTGLTQAAVESVKGLDAYELAKRLCFSVGRNYHDHWPEKKEKTNDKRS